MILIESPFVVPQVFFASAALYISLAIVVFFNLWKPLRQRLQKSDCKKKVLILGTSKEARKIVRDLHADQLPGYEIKGFVDDIADKTVADILHYQVLGNYEQLQEIIEREHIAKVVVALADCRGKLPIEVLLACKLRGVEVEEGSTFYEQACKKIMLENLRPSWFVFSQGFSLSSHMRFLKRLEDILLSLLILVLTAPIMLCVALLITLDSQGCVFYRQQRVGWAGQLFTLIKFRSMREDAKPSLAPFLRRRTTSVSHVWGGCSASRVLMNYHNS